MCGVAGIYSERLGVEWREQTVGRMLDAIKHRGPDQFGISSLGNVTLGMVRLSIIDNEMHKIPYSEEEGRYLLSYNGEIYNHLQIRQEHALKHHYSNQSDTETLVHSLEEWDFASLLKKINGMFAIAAYDSFENKLYLARDIAGEKNIYIMFFKGGFAFASEVKALKEIADLKINEGCLSYNSFEVCHDRETLFEGVNSLLPGEYLTFDGVNIFTKRYWEISQNVSVIIRDMEDDYVDELDRLLNESIRLRIGNRAVELGALLSGGVDSSLVCALSKPKYLFTLGYPSLGEEFNEIEYAKRTAKFLGGELIIVTPTKDDFEEFRETIIYHLDFPCTWTSFNLFCILKEASRFVKITLSGEGADELFGGYYRYHLVNHDEQIHQLEALEKYSPLINKYYGPAYQRYAKLISRAENPYDQQTMKYVEGITQESFSKFSHVVHSMGHVDFYTSMQVLLHMADRMSMAHSIENRAPFLDPNVISFAFGIPGELKIKNGQSKYILRKLAARYIPEEIAYRKDKRGFLAPINYWYGSQGQGSLKQFDRGFYKNLVFEDWKRVFNLRPN